MSSVLAQLARGVGDVVFPPVCVHCRALVERDEARMVGAGIRHLCTRCAGQLDFVRPPHCSTCGHPFYGEVAGARMGPHCDGLYPAFGEGGPWCCSRGRRARW